MVRWCASNASRVLDVKEGRKEGKSNQVISNSTQVIQLYSCIHSSGVSFSLCTAPVDIGFGKG